MSKKPSIVHALISPTAWAVCDHYKARQDAVSEFLITISQEEVWAVVNGNDKQLAHWHYLNDVARKFDRHKHFIGRCLHIPSKYRTIKPKTVITDVLLSLNSPKVL